MEKKFRGYLLVARNAVFINRVYGFEEVGKETVEVKEYLLELVENWNSWARTVILGDHHAEVALGKKQTPNLQTLKDSHSLLKTRWELQETIKDFYQNLRKNESSRTKLPIDDYNRILYEGSSYIDKIRKAMDKVTGTSLDTNFTEAGAKEGSNVDCAKSPEFRKNTNMQTKVIEAILESDIPSFEKISKTTEKWWGGRIAGFNIMQICGQLGDEEMAKALMSEAECDDALYAVLEEKYMNQLTPHDMSALFGFLKTATVLKHKTDAESNIPSKANHVCNDHVRDSKNGGYSSNPSTTAAIINIRKNTLKMHGNKRMSVGTLMSVSNEKYTKNDALDSHSALYELETPVFRIKAENGTFRGTDSCNTTIVRGWDSKTNVNSDLIIAESTDDSELFINIDWIKLDSISFERSMKLEEVTDSEAENSLQTCRDSAECTVLKVGGFSPLERYRNIHNYKIGPYPQYSFLGPQFLQVFLAGNCGQQYSVEIDVDISTPYLSKNEIGDKKSEELKYIQTHYNWRVPNDVTLLCGHRGSGANSAVGGDGVRLQLRENTIKSMYEAHRSGASVVEFDIQLSRDSVPVVHHDWGTVVENGLKVQINDLTVQQFQGLGSCIQPQTSGALAASSNTNSKDTMSRIHFTFEELLEGLPMDLGMNVEIKYPISDEAKYFGVEKTFELNWRYATKKHSHENTSGEHTPLNNVPVIFSSFHPDVCILLKRKVGHIFPVFFLTMGGVYKLSNPLCNSVAQAVNFATLHGLSGVVSDSVAITDAPSLVHFVHASGLSLATYGRRNNDADFVRIQCDSHVNMIITDSVRMVKSVLEEK